MDPVGDAGSWAVWAVASAKSTDAAPTSVERCILFRWVGFALCCCFEVLVAIKKR